MQSEFINELGNAITVCTARICSDSDYDEVNLCIEGPASCSSWTVTYKEATSIWQQLGKVLKPSADMKPGDAACSASD